MLQSSFGGQESGGVRSQTTGSFCSVFTQPEKSAAVSLAMQYGGHKGMQAILESTP